MGEVGKDYKGCEGTLGDDVYVQHLDCSDGSGYIFMSKLIKLFNYVQFIVCQLYRVYNTMYINMAVLKKKNGWLGLRLKDSDLINLPSVFIKSFALRFRCIAEVGSVILGHFSFPGPRILAEPFPTWWTGAEGDGPTIAGARVEGCQVLKSIASAPGIQPSCLEARATLAFDRRHTFPFQRLSIHSSLMLPCDNFFFF